MKRGDILLYRAGSNWRDRLISWMCHGPYVHTGILVHEKVIIAADPAGIGYFRIPDNAETYDVIGLCQYADEEHIEAGVQWAMQQFGKQYGWLDILYQAIKFVNPNNPFRFGQKDCFDCSDLVTRYLQQCGVVLPDGFNEPYCNTPCDLGRIFGLIPMRPGIDVEPIKPLEVG